MVVDELLLHTQQQVSESEAENTNSLWTEYISHIAVLG